MEEATRSGQGPEESVEPSKKKNSIAWLRMLLFTGRKSVSNELQSPWMEEVVAHYQAPFLYFPAGYEE